MSIDGDKSVAPTLASFQGDGGASTLWHYTVNTGTGRETPRAAVSGDELAALRPCIAEARATGSGRLPDRRRTAMRARALRQRRGGYWLTLKREAPGMAHWCINDANGRTLMDCVAYWTRGGLRMASAIPGYAAPVADSQARLPALLALRCPALEEAESMYCDVCAHEHDWEAGMSPGHVLHVMTASGWAAARLRCIAWVLIEGV